ncbi:hypothetical protein [Sandaracinus amylolyticus]|uniref:Uncharacterized protein n=1 Tax=Sandaracinus amylolyticus TaxID=927083 RepID=A0A0F6SHK7_9BACT|nr:hypothetical protein [Sandaracinus amylolyticus]AKF10614.1 hypothetical protein DB32_007763 [Sandaracinus amylolyticus]
MAREDKSQTSARTGVGRYVEGVGTRLKRDEDPRSRVGLPERGAKKKSKSKTKAIDAGDRSAFDARATNVAARKAGTRGRTTARGSDDEDTSARGATSSGGRRVKSKAKTKKARGPAQERAREGLRGPSARDARAKGREPRGEHSSAGSAPGIGTITRPVRVGESHFIERDGEDVPPGRRRAAGTVGGRAKPRRDHSPPTRAAKASGGRSTGARGGSGGGRSRPTDAGAHAASGRSGSRKAVKKSTEQAMRPSVRGAASSGEQRGATLGPRKGVRLAGAPSRGTSSKPGLARGSSKSNAGRRSRATT